MLPCLTGTIINGVASDGGETCHFLAFRSPISVFVRARASACFASGNLASLMLIAATGREASGGSALVLKITIDFLMS